MNQKFYEYPAGWSGTALVALRISLAAFVLIAVAEVPDLALWTVCAMVAVASLILAGWHARTASILSSLVAALVWTKVDSGVLVLPHLLDAVALVMIGPGAYSIDALMYGRKTMHLSE